MTQEQLDNMHAYRDQYLVDHDRLQRRMTVALFDWSVVNYRLESATYREKRRALEAEYEQLAEGRAELNMAQTVKFRALLTPDQNFLLPEWKYKRQQPKRWTADQNPLRPQRLRPHNDWATVTTAPTLTQPATTKPAGQ